MNYDAYIMTKKIINKEIEQIEKETQPINSKNTECMMMLLIALTKIIINKQEIVYKNKQQQTITNLIPEYEINNMVRRGIFKIYDTPTAQKRTTHQEKKIKIIDINEEKKNNYPWIIDNIRDSLAHNKFKLNFEKQAIEINNTLEERKLICEIDFYWIIRFSFVLSNTRIENNSRTLKLDPYIYQENQEYEQINNIKNLNKLYKSIQTCMLELTLKEDIPEEKIPKIKENIRKIWSQDINIITEKDKEYLMDLYYEMQFNNKQIDIKYMLNNKKLKERLKKIKKYCKEIKKIEYTTEELTEYIENKIKQTKTFTQLNSIDQNKIFTKLIGIKLFNYDNKQTKIEDGLDMIMNNEFSLNNKRADKYYMNNPMERIIEQLCYKEEKLLSALYLLGTTTFMLNKEKIFDKIVDYETIDTKNIIKMDMMTPSRLEETKEQNIELLLKNLKFQKNTLNKINKLNKSKIKNEEKIIPQIEKELEKLKQQQIKNKEIKTKLSIISKQQRKIKTIDNKKYIEVNNKEFMRHLRNALAHTWIYYKDNNTNPMERIVEIKDFTDKNELAFIAQAPYKEWINLFNNKTFENAIKNYTEETNDKQLKLKYVQN